MTAVTDLDRLVQRRHLLTHPFYVSWSKGELSEETLRAYAEQYYHFEANFPRYVAGTYARIQDPRARRVLLENLVDEEGRERTHPELWADFAQSVGAPSDPRRYRHASPATRDLCRTYEEATVQGTAGSGLGALYAYESQFPAVAAEKSRGLRAFYGIEDAAAHEFFRVHSVADIEHAAAERKALVSLLKGDARTGRAAELGTRRALDAWWGFLDAFCH
jgi:pyrroloquinoline-quinone synthase